MTPEAIDHPVPGPAAPGSSSCIRSSRSSTTASPVTTSSPRRSGSDSTTTPRLLDDPDLRLAIVHSFVLLVTPILIFLSICLAIIVNRRMPDHLFRALYSCPP